MRAREQRSLTTRRCCGDLAPRQPNREQTQQDASGALPIELLHGARFAGEWALEHVHVGALVDLGVRVDVRRAATRRSQHWTPARRSRRRERTLLSAGHRLVVLVGWLPRRLCFLGL